MNSIENETSTKLRGGYYTDPDIAAFLARWVLRTGPAVLLEPSCGDGVFIEAIGRSNPSSLRNLAAFEIDSIEAAKARQRAACLRPRGVRVLTKDFLEWCLSNLDRLERFDGVVGNPPFIRYQYLSDDEQQRMRKVFEWFGLPFTGHTNAWVPFVILSIACLKPGGRLAMVVPAEILHVLYAEPLRAFLSNKCSKILILDTEEFWFGDALQGVVLLLAEKRSSTPALEHCLAVATVRGRAFLKEDAESYFERARFMKAAELAGKWTRALLTSAERRLLDGIAHHSGVFRFREVASVDVGIVTGANKFFLVNDEVVYRYGLGPWVKPMFGRSSHARGVIYDRQTHEENRRARVATNFLWLKEADISQYPEAVRDYIRLGEAEGIDRRYKCRIRKPWYKVPSVSSAPVAMLKRCHFYPRLILNRLGALTTDTAYRVRPAGVAADRLVSSFVNSLTALTAELEGRHYGGGVLELVPSEIERLLVALPETRPGENLAGELLNRLDRAVRRGAPPETLLPTQDRLLLGAVGVGRDEREALFVAWDRLRRRRLRATEAADTEDQK